MEPEITLIFVFVATLVVLKFFKRKFLWKQSGQIAMSAMLIVTSIGHVIYSVGMEKMIPAVIPFKTEIVYLTGLFEFACAVALFFPSLRKITGWVLIIFLTLITPANIYAAVNNINIETGRQDGDGLAYLWYRIPLQILFISWVYFSSIDKNNDNPDIKKKMNLKK